MSYKSFLNTLLFLLITFLTLFKPALSARRSSCNANCDFRISDLAISNNQLYFSKDSSYFVFENQSMNIQIVNIADAQSKTIPRPANHLLSYNKFMHEIVVQFSGDSNPAPKKLDLSKSYA